MWFAALSGARSNPWFLNFMNKLHSGSKPVLSLHDPFLDHPPRYLKIKSAPLFFRHILRKVAQPPNLATRTNRRLLVRPLEHGIRSGFDEPAVP